MAGDTRLLSRLSAIFLALGSAGATMAAATTDFRVPGILIASTTLVGALVLRALGRILADPE